ncbi:type VII secretion protein EccE [Mycobacterium paragordonae]|uniref:Type VII secretion protein EccE n=1 Tax=Mycobacterium paragordonae TaxID=1389713 RepID=A0AAJ1SA64_9MYCO|nr:type VII secretion protein EccE [Mycobacterium paragordonae]MDP7739540.1 type VII secretion protein EccE [Mycobacterium paragordonae]
MTPTFPLGLALGWARLVCVFVIDVALLGAGVALAGRPGWWTALAVAVLVSVAALLCWRGAPLLSLGWRAVRAHRAHQGAPAGQLDDHERTFGGGPVGIRAVGTHLVAVIAVDGQPHSPSVLDYPRAVSMTSLPLTTLAGALRQFDVTLAGIDVLSAGSRRAGKTHHPYAEVYSGMVGDHPAVGQRRTWLVIRLDATASARAIVWRESVAATLAAAAEWVAHELNRLRLGARVLDAAQIRAADEALLAGADAAALHPGWRRLRHAGGHVQTYWMSPADITTANIDRLWAPDSEATVVSIQLRPGPDGATTVGVAVRYHTGYPLAEAPLTGLNPWTGRHDVAMRTSLVHAETPAAVPARDIVDDEELRAPIGATGIIIGATATGHPLLVDLGAPTGTADVTVAGELALTVAIARRAAAAGYQVLVRTDRPQQWREVLAAGLQVIDAAALAAHPCLPGQRVMVIFDDTEGPTPSCAVVTVRTVSAESASSADIHLEQDGPDHAVLRTWAISDRLRIDVTEERRQVTVKPRRAA